MTRMTARRHIIVEGPDGSGKDGMIRRLQPLFPQHKLHARASTSTGGPVPSLTGWLIVDMFKPMKYEGPWIYNRHPLISERIYAPIARKVEPQGSYANPAWVRRLSFDVAEACVVVWCMPPLSVVVHNVRSGDVDHMPGVAENIEKIYGAYADDIPSWPGPSVRWDYTVSDIAKVHHEIMVAMNDGR